VQEFIFQKKTMQFVLIALSLCVVSIFASFCAPLPVPPVATSVHNLRPHDIGLFLALGDSVTAGFGMNGNLDENRGASFSIGGDDTYTQDLDQARHQLEGNPIYTLPNLFKQYNPDVKGFSVGSHFVERVNTSRYNSSDELNGAQSSAKIQDVYVQIQYLMERIESGEFGDPKTVLNKVWKHLTIFIGANNLCVSCQGADTDTPEFFGSQMGIILDTLQAKLPHTIVSIASLPKFSKLKDLEPTVSWCALVHDLYAECDCVFAKDATDQDRAMMDDYTDKYNLQFRSLRESWLNKSTDEFTVILHPYLEETVIPSEEYVSTFDCFHPSRLAHQDFSMGLWNSLFLPFNEKPNVWKFNQTKLFCPTADDYIRTN
jgi:phospholipase B1